MRPNGRAIGIGALVLAILVAFALRGSSEQDSPDHRTDSDAPNGASALPQLAQALGHPTATIRGAFSPDLGIGVLFVLSPQVPFSPSEVKLVTDYVSGGGTLVYAAERGDPRLDAALNVARRPLLVGGEATTAGPMLAGLRRVAGAPAVVPLAPSTSQAVLLRSPGQEALAIEERIGRGRAFVLADPLPLCNGQLGQADNGRLAADLVSLASGDRSVAFDEFHHETAAAGSQLTGWLGTPWGAAVGWSAVALFVGLLLRGRAFGPYLARPGGAPRSTAEHVAAVGGLLQRSRAARLTGELLGGATRRALAARHGLAVTNDLGTTLRARAPEAAAELAAAEDELRRSGGGEQALLAAARRMHRLAYPDPPP